MLNYMTVDSYMHTYSSSRSVENNDTKDKYGLYILEL